MKSQAFLSTEFRFVSASVREIEMPAPPDELISQHSIQGFSRPGFAALGLLCALAVGPGPVLAATYTSIANGNWTSTSTWLGAAVPPNAVPASDTINIRHQVAYNVGTVIDNSGTIRIEPITGTTARLTLPSNINVENKSTGKFLILNAAFLQYRFVGGGDSGHAQSGTFKNLGGYVEVLNSYVEVAQDWASEGGGQRLFKNACLKSGQNFSVSGSGSTDRLLGCTLSVGWHGGGNLSLADGTIEFQQIRVQFAGTGGNFELNSGTAFGDIDYITMSNHVTGVVGSGKIGASSSLSVPGGLNLDARCTTRYEPNGKFSGPQTQNCGLNYFLTPCAVGTPAIALDKQIVSGSPYDSAGDVINYQLIATNTGNVTLTNVSISDPKLGPLTCPQPVTLLPGQTLTCTGSYTVTQLDVDRGSITNTATVSGQPPVGPPVTSSDTEIASGTQTPSVDVVKACPAGLIQPGQLLTVAGTVTNTGNITLTNVVVTNTIAALGNLSRRVLGPITLAPGAGTNFTDSYAIPLDSCGPYADTFAATAGSAASGLLVADSDTKSCPGTNAPRIFVVKHCPAIPVAPGQLATITGVVSNAGNITLTNVLVYDDQPAANTLLLGPITLPPGQAANFTNTFPLPPNCCTYVNLVRASGRDKCFGRPVTDSASAVCQTATDPRLTVTRTCPPQPVSLGQPLVFSGVVSNAGNITLTNVIVVSDQPSNHTPVLGPIVLAPGQQANFTGAFIVPPDLCDTNFLSTVTARGDSLCRGTNVSVSQSTPCPIRPTPRLVVTKDCPVNPVPPGGLLAFSGTVSNAGNVTLTNVMVVNDHPTNHTPVLGPITLAPHQAASFNGSYRVCPVCCPPYVDMITATGAQRCNGSNVTATATASCPGITTPQLSVVVDCPPAPARLGELLFYSGSVSNSGDVPLSDVLVTDDQAGFVTEIFALAPKETADFFGLYLTTNCGPNVVTLVTAAAFDFCTGGSISQQVSSACPIVCPPTEAPVLINPMISNGQFQFSFATEAGRTYTVQYTDDVQPVNWLPLGGAFPGDGNLVTITDPMTNLKRFYRVRVQ